MKIIAKTFQGLEEVLAKELTSLGANDIVIGNRMVSFTGDKEMLYRANFCLRTAVKVLMPIKEFKANDADEVYEKVKEMDWETYMDENMTFLVDSVVFSEDFRHSKFVAYRVKDAIADYFREKTEKRPNVSISNPDIRINVHIAENDVTISLDSSGESLHKRGYRTGSGAAPLNEVLAAGMILLTGWDGQCDLIDPFCGSGTILVEAALIAQNVYPGVFREEFAFERWKDFDEDLLEEIYNDDSQERDFNYKIYGFDINRQAVAIATDNARSAGVSKIVDVQQQDFYEFEWNPKSKLEDDEIDESEVLSKKAIIITNPPYGERITTDDILDLYATIGSRLKQQFVGNDAWILSYHEECFAKIGFRPSTKIALYNGALPCEFRKYQVFDGKLKDRREEGLDIKSDDERKRNAKFRPNRKHEEGEFDGTGWRGEGSRDDDHYFKSRPDRNKREPWKENRREDKAEKRKPLFEGDDEPELNRYNFKWGDRSSNYGRDAEHHGQRSRFDDDDYDDSRSDKPSFGKGGKGKSHDHKSKDGKGGKGGGKGRSHEDSRQRHDKREKGEKKNTKWGFDSEGRPFKRDEDE